MDKMIIPMGEAPEDPINVGLNPIDDPYAITHEEHFTPVQFELNSWDRAEPSGWGDGDKIECVLAGSKKLFQRGIIQMSVNGGKPFYFKIDGLMTAIYKTYKVENPYKGNSKFEL